MRLRSTAKIDSGCERPDTGREIKSSVLGCAAVSVCSCTTSGLEARFSLEQPMGGIALKRRTKLLWTAALGIGALSLTIWAANMRRDGAVAISLSDPYSEDAVERCLVRVQVEGGSLAIRTVDAPHELMGHLQRFPENNAVGLFMGTTAVMDVTNCIEDAGLDHLLDTVPEYH